jgi:glutamate racemase
MAVGGAAYLVSKAIKTAKVVGFADLGMEAIYEFDVVDMPVTVAVDAGGTSAHITGPAEWQKRIATVSSNLPIVGIEPALKPPLANSKTRHIGVMATRGTLNSEKFRTLLANP